AFDEPGRLPECHAEQHLHCQASLNGSIAVCLLATTLACRRGIPGHLGVKPDRQRAPALERFIVGWPVPGLVSRGCVSAHASQLPHWIHEMNPSPDLCNRAAADTDRRFVASAVALMPRVAGLSDDRPMPIQAAPS